MLDAVRVRDGQRVVFKKVKTNTDEIRIAMYLSSKENMQDPRNHTVPILDVIMLPGTDDEALLVMPLLLKFHLLPFRFLGEFCEFALQILEVRNVMLSYIYVILPSTSNERRLRDSNSCMNTTLLTGRILVLPRLCKFLYMLLQRCMLSQSHDGCHKGCSERTSLLCLEHS